MFRNYFKTAIRNLWKGKGFAIINISGLAVGMASAGLILLWVQNELRYDRFYPKIDRLYSAWNRDVFDGKITCWRVTPKTMAPSLKKDFPEVEQACRVNWNQAMLFTLGDRTLKAIGNMVDPDMLTMFDLPMIRGNRETALNSAYSIVITESFAKKLFGNEDAMNKSVRIDNLDNFTVSGILKNHPNNTDFDFEYLLPWSYMKKRGWDDSSWDNNSTSTYVLLRQNSSLELFNQKVKNIQKSHVNYQSKDEVFLYPVSRLWLYSNFENGKPTGGRIGSVRIFLIIAAFILVIACINFMNLSTARSEKRAKEVGIRKVAGAAKGSLVSQFLLESILIAFGAGLIALLIISLSLPSFNDLTKKHLILNFGNIWFWIDGISFILFTGILAGSYPAFFLSAFRPVIVLKGTFKKAHASVTPRKLLVILQFSFAIILIISTIIVTQQLKYAQDRETGYARNNLAYVFLEGDIPKNYDLIKNELLSSGAVSAVSKTSAPLTEGWSNSWGMGWEGKDPNLKTLINRFCSDGNLVKTAGMQVVQGRDIDLKNYPGDSVACIINEAALRLMKFKSPIGQYVHDDGRNWTIVGVIKDFILQSPFKPVEPMVIEGPKAWFNVIHFRFNEENSQAKNLSLAENVFRKYNPAYPFNPIFIDEEYEKKFSDGKQIRALASLFAELTIFISCLGLFGLASYMAENRIREIGIRKVLGASVIGITALLSKEFLMLILISVAVASPIAWWSMEQWLQAFPYRISISVWVFLAAAVLSIFIALLTVSFQSIRAALANPVKSLRTE